ncbi:MAG: hypothetical protein AAFX52_07820 [Pseudomonadota bacterium]
MGRLQTSMAFLLAVWALVLPTLAAAHDHDHDHEGHSDEPVICICAAYVDRDDDPVVPSDLPPITVTSSSSVALISTLFDLTDLASPSGEAIRAPPAA